jgi:hypothetical protein
MGSQWGSVQDSLRRLLLIILFPAFVILAPECKKENTLQPKTQVATDRIDGEALAGSAKVVMAKNAIGPVAIEWAG